ncbi:lipopolysaccharide assembly LapA domain-containing protein [Gordonia zhaorongruii]|uniref:LapA family protein n=1 Tax=Gordonia zhaorongruii TaxID=2597659 RepID=UPI0010496D0D|nr:lipopolysaccharide assembly protein LapA domain-containing protein [Gordonia zhaorongruii]
MTTHEPHDRTENPDLPTTDRTAADAIAHTRTRATYVGWIVGILVTILLLIFILQNTESQEIHFLNLTANVPVGVSLLIAAIAGALITALLSGARLFQMKRALKKSIND